MKFINLLIFLYGSIISGNKYIPLLDSQSNFQ